MKKVKELEANKQDGDEQLRKCKAENKIMDQSLTEAKQRLDLMMTNKDKYENLVTSLN